MTTIAHSVLAGTEIHEPKGVADASLGQVYVADGNGSGNWAGVGTSSFTGMISDFTWPVVQDGWLECDGSDVNTTTYSALYDVMTIQQTGTRVISTATITSLSSTTNMRVGYYVFGTGIASGATVVSIDSGTQITLSTNVSSSGTSTVVVSPWLLNTGTIRLPNLTSVGRFRRSRSSSTAVGQTQTSTNVAHTHGLSGSTSSESATHTHNVSGTTSTESNLHTHTYSVPFLNDAFLQAGSAHYTAGSPGVSTTLTSNTENLAHTHSINVTSGVEQANHSHTLSGNTLSSGDTETRPETLILMTCVKT